MSAKASAAAAKLDEIEAEMKAIGYWSADPPDLLADYDGGKKRSYLDAPSFELWLQCVFLPRAREAVRAESFPAKSSVGAMAFRQYGHQSVVEEAQRLQDLLSEFDAIVEDRPL